MKRYLLNLDAKVAHDRTNLRESCNTDDVKRRRQSDVIPRGYTLCQHCGETR